MAMMESCFQDWNGPTHHNITTSCWVTSHEFACKSKTKTLTSATLALKENEVLGPRVQGPVQPANS
jgi:hypothetical protein